MVRRTFLFAVLFFAGTVLSAFASGFAYAHALPDGVTVSIQPVKNNLSADDKVLIKLTYTNHGAEEVRLLKWATGLEGRIDEDILSIWFEEQELEYRGRHFKRAAPTAQDYVVLSEGQYVSKTVDLQLSYEIELAGSYRINWRADLELAANEQTSRQVLAQKGTNLVLLDNIYLQPLSGITSQTPTYQNCSIDQAAEIRASVVVAESYARTARDSLSGAPLSKRPTARRYKEWFGNYDAGRWAIVQNHFNQIYSALATRTINFDCGCNLGYYAYVTKSDHYNITVCNAFWSASRTGTDSKAGTIIHELSHFTVVANTDDIEDSSGTYYGQSRSRLLAIIDPSSAIRHADGHEYFAENSPPLDMPNGADDPGNTDPGPEPEPVPVPEPVIPSFLAAIYALLFSEEKAR